MRSLLNTLRSLVARTRFERDFAARRVVHGLTGDLRLALRRLLATPMFTAFAVLSLAVGLAVTTAAYSVVAAIFFGSSGIEDEDRVAAVMTAWDGRVMNGGFSVPDFADLRAAQTSFSSVTASATFFPSVTTESTTELMRAEAVDAAYFRTLGVHLALGRGIDETDVANAQPVVVLGHALWTLRFGADPGVLGRQVRIAGRLFEVVGIAPRHFEGFGRKLQGARLWIPLSTDPRRPRSAIAERDRSTLIVVGRLTPDATLASASAEMTSLGANLDTSYPRPPDRSGPRKRNWVVRPLSEDRPGDEITFRFGLAFVALVALVLVVACTNLANLVLARGAARHHEVAVRRALGASRWRLVREQCAESLILAGAGAAAAWLVFSGLGALMDVELPIAGKMLISFAPTLDLTVLGMAAAALLLALFVFGLEPALQLTRSKEVRTELSTIAGSVGAPKIRRQRALVRWQVAISSGFFIIATMCVKYAVAEARHDSGVDLDRIAVATMNFWAQQWDEDRARRALSRVLEEVERDPAIAGAAISTGVPFGSSSTDTVAFSTIDKPITDRDHSAWGLGIATTPQFFRTMGITVVRGRAFDDRDLSAGTPVVVISEQTARALFGTNDVVGRQILVKPRSITGPARRTVARALALPGRPPSPTNTADVRTATIVGVAENTDVVHLFSREGEVLYFPMEQQAGDLVFAIAVVRTDGSPYAALHTLREAIRKVDPDLATESSGTGAGALGGPTVFLRAGSMFAVSLGALTLLLSMIGLYGVQSHGVARRTREIGVRMSFGATAAQIRAMVLKDGCKPVLQGLGLGLFIGFVGRGILRAFLWERIDLVDPWMVLAVPVPLLFAGFLACYWPARRAARVDPMVALRHL